MIHVSKKVEQEPSAPPDIREWFVPIIQAMQEGFLLQDKEGKIVACNTAAEIILGMTQCQILGLTSLDPRWHAVHADGSDCSPELHPATITLKTGQAIRGMILGIHRSGGELRWLSVNSAPLLQEGGDTPYGVVITFVDITEVRQSQERLQATNAHLTALAMEDSLTGLLNHRAFYERLSEEFHRNARYAMPLSLLFFDVDLFKPFNDTFGHRAGDNVLKSLAFLIRSAIRESDIAARYGGEEFAILLPETETDGAVELAERLRSTVAEYSWPLRPVTISIGAATLDTSLHSPSALVEAADRAMYGAKAHGRNCVAHYRFLVKK